MGEPVRDRPRQVTLAGWLLMVGSGLVVVLVYQRVGTLNSLETQAAVDRFLSEPPGSDLGVSDDTVTAVLRTLAMITGGCAAAAGILGYQVLRRSRSARLAVTVLAVPLFFAGMVTGGFLTSVVAASAAMLWLQPSRSWFRDAPSSPGSSSAQGSRDAPSSPRGSSTQGFRDAPSSLGSSSTQGSRDAPSSLGGSSTQGSAGTTPPERPVGPVAPPSYADPAAPPAPAGRPAPVLWACVLTWVCTAVTIAGLVTSGVVLAVSPEPLLDQMHRDNPQLAEQGISDDVLLTATYLMMGALVVWCVGAAVLAVLVLRRADWARIVLIISAATAAALCLLGTLVGAVILAVPLLASALCIGLLVRPETRAWFAPRRDSP